MSKPTSKQMTMPPRTPIPSSIPTPAALSAASGPPISFSDALSLLHETPPLPSSTTTTTSPAGSTRTFTGKVKRDWCAGYVAHGGILTALLLRSVGLYVSAEGRGSGKLAEILKLQIHPISLHLEFLSKTDVGVIVIRVVPVKVGRQYSVFGVKLLQGPKGGRVSGAGVGVEKECITGLITFGNMLQLENHVDGFSFDPVVKIPHRVKECCKKDLTGNKFIEFGIAGAKLEYWLPVQTEEEWERKRVEQGVMLEQWVRFEDFERTREGFGLETLGFLVDSYSLLPENLIKNVLPGDFWYPTLLLDLEVKNVPPANLGYWEWLFMRISINKVKNGRMDNIISVYDESGEMVARASQVGLIVGGQRNINTIDTGKKPVAGDGTVKAEAKL